MVMLIDAEEGFGINMKAWSNSVLLHLVDRVVEVLVTYVWFQCLRIKKQNNQGSGPRIKAGLSKRESEIRLQMDWVMLKLQNAGG